MLLKSTHTPIETQRTIMKKLSAKDLIPAIDTISVAPGEMLATLRQLQGLTQGAFAKATGMTQANISNMESGRQQIGRDRALTLAKSLHVHPAVILFPNYQVNAPRSASTRLRAQGVLSSRRRRASIATPKQLRKSTL